MQYTHNKSEIQKLIKKAFNKKLKLKIRYYSLYSDQHTTRIIEIYQLHTNAIIAFCNLRQEERTFRIDRISSAKLLDEQYAIPKNWSSENIILNT